MREKKFDSVLFIRFSDGSTTVRVTEEMLNDITEQSGHWKISANRYVIKRIWDAARVYIATVQPPSLAGVREACEASCRTFSELVRDAFHPP